MDRAKQRVESRSRISERIRRKVTGTTERPRLAIFKSQKHIYAQIIDDGAGRTLASASSADKDSSTKGANAAAAKAVGALIAKRAKDKGITRVVFDRGGYLYHGNVKALADAARENGLEF
jgi:large subunit ribosomal protein L18